MSLNKFLDDTFTLNSMNQQNKNMVITYTHGTKIKTKTIKYRSNLYKKMLRHVATDDMRDDFGFELRGDRLFEKKFKIKRNLDANTVVLDTPPSGTDIYDYLINNVGTTFRLIGIVNNVVVTDVSYTNYTPNMWKRDIYYDYNNAADYQYDKIYIHLGTDIQLPINEFKQYFREGVSNCVIKPIRSDLTSAYSNAKSKEYKRKLINQLKKLRTLEAQYENGFDYDGIQEICNTINCNITIYEPFGKKIMRQLKSDKRAQRRYTFLNTGLNHVDGITQSKKRKIELDSYKIQDKLTELKEKQIFYTYSRYGSKIYEINTLTDDYILHTRYKTVSNVFNSDSNVFKINDKHMPHLYNFLDPLKICDIENKILSSFVRHGVHICGVIDFQEYKEQPLCHIDQSKAYTRFNKYDFYEGILGKIHEFRKCNKIHGLGLYQIKNVINPNNKFHNITNKFKIDFEGLVLPSPEIKFLKKYGYKFDIVAGCWGSKIDFHFTKEMFERESESKGPRFYSLWCGKTAVNFNEYNSTTIKGDKHYAEIMKKYVDAQNVTMFGKDDIVLKWKKQSNKHCSHILAFITSYQRMYMYLQLLQMNIKKVVRVNTDGIFYNDHKFRILPFFRPKKSILHRVKKSECFISNFEYTFNLDIDTEMKTEYSDVIGITGPGGSGKTWDLLKDKGLIKPLYIAPSRKLTRAKYHEFGCDSEVLANIVSNDKMKINNIYNKYNVFIIDEVSQMNQISCSKIKEMYNGIQLYFVGDVGYQLNPIKYLNMSGNKTDEMINKIKNSSCGYLKKMTDPHKIITLESIAKKYDDKRDFSKKYITIWDNTLDEDLVKFYYYSEIELDIHNMKQHRHKNIIRRFDDNDKIRNFSKELRRQIDLKCRINLNILGQYDARIITFEEALKIYDKKDMIIASTNEDKNRYTESLKHIKKWYVTKNSLNYSNGDIVIQDEKPETQCEIRHAYTVHSIQGETTDYKLFIHLNRIYSYRMLYTAISRCRRWEQIYFVNT